MPRDMQQVQLTQARQSLLHLPENQEPHRQAMAECSEDEISEPLDLGPEAGFAEEYELGDQPVWHHGINEMPQAPGASFFAASTSIPQTHRTSAQAWPGPLPTPYMASANTDEADRFGGSFQNAPILGPSPNDLAMHFSAQPPFAHMPSGNAGCSSQPFNGNASHSDSGTRVGGGAAPRPEWTNKSSV